MKCMKYVNKVNIISFFICTYKFNVYLIFKSYFIMPNKNYVWEKLLIIIAITPINSIPSKILN